MESIEGVFDGPPYPWINLDGTRKKLSEDELRKLSGLERDVYEHWNDAPISGRRWFDDQKRFTELPPHELSKLDRFDRACYQIARIKDMLARRRQKAA